MDCQNNPHICQTAGIRAYPTVKFYPFQGEKKVNNWAGYCWSGVSHAGRYRYFFV